MPTTITLHFNDDGSLDDKAGVDVVVDGFKYIADTPEKALGIAQWLRKTINDARHAKDAENTTGFRKP